MIPDRSLSLMPRLLPEPVGHYANQPPAAARNLFIFGLGYTGQYLGRRLLAAGWRVGSTSRDPETRREMALLGFEMVDFATAPELLGEGYDQILSTIGPEGTPGNDTDGDDPVLTAHGTTLSARRWRWLGYVSSTSVYGGSDDEWIDEQTPPVPDTPRGVRRLKAEQGWRELAERTGSPLSLLRCAGIYGPGRNIIDQLRTDKARTIDKPGHVFNRIHVEDIARAVAFRLSHAASGSSANTNTSAVTIDNLADGQPMSQVEWVAKAAGLIGIEPPAPVPYETAARTMSPMGLGFWQHSRRIRKPVFQTT